MAKSRSAAASPGDIANLFPSVNGQSLTSFNDGFSRMFRNATAVQTQWTYFVTRRIEKDAQLWSRFSACRTPDDFIALQSEAVNSWIGDCMQTGAKLFDLCMASDESKCAALVE